MRRTNRRASSLTRCRCHLWENRLVADRHRGLINLDQVAARHPKSQLRAGAGAGRCSKAGRGPANGNGTGRSWMCCARSAVKGRKGRQKH